MNFDIFRSRLSALITSRGLTPSSFADEIGLTRATVSRYLTADRAPTLSYVAQIAEFFGVSLDWLVGFGEDRYTQFSPDIQELINLYSLASENDRKVVHAVLDQYKGAI